jgi:cyanophycinase
MTTIPHLPLPGTDGWLILIGGGEFSFGETEEIDRFFLSKLTSKRIAFLPTASGSQEYARHLGEYFKRLDSEAELVNVPVFRGRDVRREKSLAMIREAGGVYLGGGVTNLFVETIRESPVEVELRNLLARGGVIAAMGAAASSLGAVTRDMRSVGAALPGLSLMPGTVIETAFDARTNEMLRRLMSDPAAQIGLGIPPRTALAIAPSREGTILGDGSVTLLRKA